MLTGNLVMLTGIPDLQVLTGNLVMFTGTVDSKMLTGNLVHSALWVVPR